LAINREEEDMGTTETTAAKKAGVQVAATPLVQATEEQLLYAKVLDTAMKIGLAGIIVVFAFYLFGVFEPKIPLADVSKYWGMKSHDYPEATNIKSGWAWTGMYRHGDFLNFFPIAFLAGITVLCYLSIVPTLFKKKDSIYGILALIEVLILVAAASGLISAGGH